MECSPSRSPLLIFGVHSALFDCLLLQSGARELLATYGRQGVSRQADGDAVTEGGLARDDASPRDGLRRGDGSTAQRAAPVLVSGGQVF